MKKKLTHFVRFLILPIAFLLLSNNAFSQGVGINNPVPDVSALLDLTSQTQGLLAPRMTSVQRIAIATPAKGLLVYDTDLNMYMVYNGTTWQGLLSSNPLTNNSNSWLTLGNAILSAPTSFIGTIDNTDFIFKTNNIERMRITANGLIFTNSQGNGVQNIFFGDSAGYSITTGNKD